MRKEIKKVFAAILALACCTGALYGCGKDGKTIDTSENITITLSGPQGATDDWQNTNLIEGLQEKFGMTIACEPLASDSWSTKFSLMLAEDEMPDLVVNPQITIEKVNEYAEQGYFLAFSDYLDVMPNLKAFLKEHPDYEKYCTSEDGSIYALVKYDDYKYNNLPRVWIRTDWLENVGMEYPTTIDEFYDVLKAFRDKDANGNGDATDELPMAFSSKYVRKLEHSLMPAFGINAGGGTTDMYYILKATDGKIGLEQTTDKFKAYLTFIHKLWEEGLLYNESYSIDIAQLRELVSDNRVGVYSDAAGSYYSKTGEVNNNFDLLAGMTSQWNDTPFVGMTSSIGSTVKFVVNSTTENPERICQMIDFFFSEDGRRAGQYGFEERELIPSDIEGFEEFGTPVETVPEGYDSYEAYRHKKLVINDSFNILGYDEPGVAYMAENGPQDKLGALLEWEDIADDAWIVRLKQRSELTFKEAFPPMVYPSEIMDERATLKSDIQNYIKTSWAQFVTGQLDIEKDWNTYIETLNKMGLEKLLSYEQQAYDLIK